VTGICETGICGTNTVKNAGGGKCETEKMKHQKCRGGNPRKTN